MLLKDWLQIRGSYDPSSGLINLLVQLTELTKPVSSLDHQFIVMDIKVANQ